MKDNVRTFKKDEINVTKPSDLKSSWSAPRIVQLDGHETKGKTGPANSENAEPKNRGPAGVS